MLARAQAAGGSVPRAGGTTPWGGYSGIFVDPEGHPEALRRWLSTRS